MKTRLNDTEMVTAWQLLEHVHSVLTKRLEGRLAELDLTQSQADALTLLAKIDQPLPLSRVARLLKQEPQRMTWMMDRLESRGLVQRVPHPTDRRVIHVHLTSSGDQLGRRARQAMQEGLANGLGCLEPRTFACFTDALRQLASDGEFP